MNQIMEILERVPAYYKGYISRFGLTRFVTLSIVVLALSLGFTYCLFAAYKGLAAMRRSGGDRAIAAVSLTQTLGSLVILLAILVIGNRFLGAPVMLESSGKEPVEQGDLTQLEASNWAQMGVEGRVKALQTIVDVEREKLGITERLVVVTDDLQEREGGNYSELTGKITVDREYLASAPEWRMIELACHEVYHSYQRSLVELYENATPQSRRLKLFDKVKQYRWENLHYADISEDDAEFEEYYNQELEKDARAYATETAPEYYPWMEGKVPEESALTES